MLAGVIFSQHMPDECRIMLTIAELAALINPKTEAFENYSNLNGLKLTIAGAYLEWQSGRAIGIGLSFCGNWYLVTIPTLLQLQKSWDERGWQ